MSRAVRELAKALYERTKTEPWEIYSRRATSPEVWIDGDGYQLSLFYDDFDGIGTEVTIEVNGKQVYPGGRYWAVLPWRWERKLQKRLTHFAATHKHIVPTRVGYHLKLEQAEWEAHQVKRQDVLAKLQAPDGKPPAGSLSYTPKGTGDLSLTEGK